jgi:hypothetical protein
VGTDGMAKEHLPSHHSGIASHHEARGRKVSGWRRVRHPEKTFARPRDELRDKGSAPALAVPASKRLPESTP